MMSGDVLVKNFDELGVDLLYEILRLRAEIFVVEQNCAYQDLDGLDQISVHFALLNEDDSLCSCCRLIKPHAGQDYVKLGRFVTEKQARRRGAGTRVLRTAVVYALESWPEKDLKVSGQLYLEKYYTKQGFTAISDVYLEDNIPHKLFLYRKEEAL